jgi:hypothetical protein
VLGRGPAVSDEVIPDSWVDGTHAWHDILARAHSYVEPIHIYEGRVLVRGIEIIVKIPMFRRAILVVLEDNSVVVGSFKKGRSSIWHVNRVCTRRTSLELAGDLVVVPVWCSTKRMPMDALSRHRVAHRTVVKRIYHVLPSTSRTSQARPDLA